MNGTYVMLGLIKSERYNTVVILNIKSEKSWKNLNFFTTTKLEFVVLYKLVITYSKCYKIRTCKNSTKKYMRRM